MNTTPLLALLALGSLCAAGAQAQTPPAGAAPPAAQSRQVTPVQVSPAVSAAAAPQAMPMAEPAPAATEAGAATDQSALPVGAATQRLLALQRGGTLASSTPRPIPGEVAHRSYERYLNSFNHPIPDRYGSSVSVRPGGAATGTGASTGLGR